MYLGTDIILHVKQIKYYLRKKKYKSPSQGMGAGSQWAQGKKKELCTVAHTMVITTVCYCYVLEQA